MTLEYAVPPPPLASEVSGPAGILRVARWYLTDVNRWTRFAWARRPRRHAGDLGTATMAINEKAVCWCSSGAISRAHQDISITAPYGHGDLTDVGYAFEGLTIAARRLHPIRRNMSIADWNDRRAAGHAEILTGFDSAIAILDDFHAQFGTYAGVARLLAATP